MDQAERGSDPGVGLGAALGVVVAKAKEGPSSESGEWKFHYEGWMEGALSVLSAFTGQTVDVLREALPEQDVGWALAQEIQRAGYMGSKLRSAED